MEDTRPGQREQKTMENHGKSQFLMGKLWEKYGKITIVNGKTMGKSPFLMGKLWEHHHY
jgi:hypothetical protein